PLGYMHNSPVQHHKREHIRAHMVSSHHRAHPTSGVVSMSSTPWTPDDDEARKLLTERVDSYEVDGSLSLWERFLRWLNEALSLNVDSSGPGGIIIVIL